MDRLKGKIAIVTGAARGQGEATARLFVAEGATVMLADILADEVRAVAADLGPAARGRRLDVRDEAGWHELVRETEAEFGQVDILINNAAIVDAAPIEELDRARFDRILAINVAGSWLGVRAIVPGMRRRRMGSIVNISSTSGLRGNANMTSYDASKWAVRGMTKAMAMEFAADNVRVNSIHPGAIDTLMLNPNAGDTTAVARSLGLPMGRVGRPGEIAYASLFLASDEASYVSGAELAVDGAWTAGFVPPEVSDYRQ